MKIKVSNYISDFFVRNGINAVFSVTGGGAMHLNDAFGHQEGMRCTYNHNEQGSAIAAEGYARVTGRPAVCCVTSGPGGTNAITGVVGGWLDSIPMFVVSGQVKRETTIWSVPELPLRQLGDQEFDIVRTVANMTKYCAMVTNADDISYHLEKALYLCGHGRPGPVWLDIPLDIQGAMVDTENLKHFSPDEISDAFSPVSQETAAAVIEKIKSAKAPMIVAGTGITLSGACEDFLKLAEKLKIPVATEWAGNDILSPDSPYFAGVPSTMGTRGGNFTVQNCDLMLSIGCRLNIRMIGYTKHEFAQKAYKIVVDIDDAELKKPSIIPDMPICADAGDFIRALLMQDYESDGRHSGWLKWAKGISEKYPLVLDEYRGTEKLNPYVFLEALFDRLGSDDVVACANGSACVMTFQSCRPKQGQRVFGNSGCASMGYGMPAALGAAVARDGKRVVCIDGDGSIMMNLQELQTISHNKLNVKIFMISNNGYLSILQTQSRFFDPPLVGVGPDNGVSFPDFRKLADAFGISYTSLKNDSELETITKALDADGPVLCEVFVDENQLFVPKLSSKVLPSGEIVSSDYEDLFPFLDREEYESNRYIYEP